MWIKSISVNGFGKLKIDRLVFSEHTNIIYGTNEAGKTSLTYFLLNSLSEPGIELSRFEPWEYPEFSGTIEFDDGKSYDIDFLNRNFLPPYKRSLLETIGFHLEDEMFDINDGVDGSVVATLKKKMEETDMGRKLSLALEKIDLFIADVPEKIASIKKELEATELEIAEINKKIDEYNSLIKNNKTLTNQIPEKREDIKKKKELLDAECAQYIKELQEEIEGLEKERANLVAKMKKLEWVNNKDPEVVSNALLLSKKQTDLSDSISRSQESISNLKEKINELGKQVEQEFHILNIENPNELEKIYLKIKNLNLLTRLCADSSDEVKPAVVKNPLHDFFEMDEDIFDQLEEEEEINRLKQIEHEDKYSQEFELLKRLQVNKESDLSLFKFLSIGSIVFSGILLTLFAIFPAYQVWLSLALGISVLFNAIFITYWLNKKKDWITFSKHFDEIEKQRVFQPTKDKIWVELNKFGIFDKLQLQNAYTDFLKTRGKEDTKEAQPNKYQDEYKTEIEKLLSEFNLDDSPEAEDNPSDFIEKIYNKSQEIVAKIRVREEQLRSHELSHFEMEKEIVGIETDLKKLLSNLDLTIEKLNQFESARTNLSELQFQQKNIERTIDELKNKKKLKPMPENLAKLNEEILEAENLLQAMISELETVKKTIEKTSITSAQVFEKLEHKDRLNRQLAALKAIPKKLTEIHSIVNNKLKSYIDEYGKSFKTTFTNLLAKIVDRNVPVVVQDNLTIKLPLDGITKDAKSYMSRATFGQMLFVYKLALYRILSGETIPLVIDNAFVNYDDERLKKALELLQEEAGDRQVLILTSDKRLLKKPLMPDANIINLPL